MKRLFYAIIFICLGILAQGQVVITVGDSTFDFQQIDSALFEANRYKDSKVTISIEPGVYDGFAINEQLSPSANGSLLIKSRTGDSTDVIIREIGGYGAVQVKNCQNITLKNLSIKSKSSNSALQINNSKNILIDKCILKTDEYGSVSSDPGTVDIIGSSWGYDTVTVEVNHCIVDGWGNGMSISGSRSILNLKGSIFRNKGRYGLVGMGGGIVLIDSCSLYNEMALDASLWSSRLTNSTLVCNGSLKVGEVENCLFLNVNSLFQLESRIIKNCVFKCEVSLRYAKLLQNNEFKNYLRLSGSDGININSNTFFERVSISSLNHAAITKNEFKDLLSMGNGRVSLFANNTVKSHVSFGYVELYNNNITGSVFIGNTNSRVSGNIFTGGFYGNCNVEGNNFWPNISAFDKKPFNIDPQYLSDSVLVAQNPLLAGVLERDKDVIDDFYGNERRSFTSLGAHELCFELDSLNVECGRPFSLMSCNKTLDSSYYWQNLKSQETYNAHNPLITLFENAEFALLNENDSIIRSVNVNLIKPDYKVFDDTLIKCNQSLNLHTAYHPSAKYSWSPSFNVSDSTIYNPIVKPEVGTEYKVEIDLKECGVFYDTVLVDVDRSPMAIAYYDLPHDSSVTFFGYHPCSDSVLWEFGDGASSNESRVEHTYSTYGEYLVLFHSYVDSLVDTDSIKVFITTDVGQTDMAHGLFYPNPTNEILNIPVQLMGEGNVFQIYNSKGKLVDQFMGASANSQLKMPNDKGAYVIRVLQQNGTIYTQTVIKN